MYHLILPRGFTIVLPCLSQDPLASPSGTENASFDCLVVFFFSPLPIPVENDSEILRFTSQNHPPLVLLR